MVVYGRHRLATLTSHPCGHRVERDVGRSPRLPLRQSTVDQTSGEHRQQDGGPSKSRAHRVSLSVRSLVAIQSGAEPPPERSFIQTNDSFRWRNDSSARRTTRSDGRSTRCVGEMVVPLANYSFHRTNDSFRWRNSRSARRTTRSIERTTRSAGEMVVPFAEPLVPLAESLVPHVIQSFHRTKRSFFRRITRTS